MSTSKKNGDELTTSILTSLPVSPAGREFSCTKNIRETSAAYCDTDSVIYLHKPSIHPEKWPDEGSGIGCCGDELELFLNGVVFVALAPKCYCLIFDKCNKRGEEYLIKSKRVTMTRENHIHINPEVYKRLILDATICCETSPDYVPDPAATRTWRIQLNHIYNKLTYLSTVTETGGKHVRPVFNKRELLRLYMWGVPPYPDQVMCINTLPFGSEYKSKCDFQDVFYPELAAPLVGLSVTVVTVTDTL
jgi:hypothetical protein